MRSGALFLLSSITASAMGASIAIRSSDTEGFLIPDLGDGIFVATMEGDHLVNVTRTGDVVPTDDATDEDVSPNLARRALPINRYGCYQASSNRNNWERARTAFNSMCNQGIWIPRDGIRYMVAGDQIAFACNWGGTGSPCSGNEYDEFLRYIAARCGSYYGGWVDMDDWKKQYGMQQRGEAICGKGNQINW